MRILLFFLLLIATQASAFRPAFPTLGVPAKPAIAPPEITCPPSVSVSTDPFSCVAPFSYSVVATDDQPGWTLTQTAGLVSGDGFPVGATVNEFTVTDTEGNSATCSFTVTVHDYVAPVAACIDHLVVFLPNVDDPSDCYDGAVARLPVSNFNDGSYDNCGLPVFLTIQRTNPYSQCILNLNPVNGHPSCNDIFPDFPSEFERAISEDTMLKIYCCEAGTAQNVVLRAYQLEPNGAFSLNASGQPIFSQCITSLEITGGYCADSITNLAGKIQLDLDANCQADANPASISDVVVKATSSSGAVIYTSSGPDGIYAFQNLGFGLQEITAQAPLPNWSFCNLPATINVQPPPLITTLYDIYAQPATNCPMMQVNMASGLARPCGPSIWTGKYCNLGAEPAENAYVDLVVPSAFSWLSASKTYSIIGDTIRVQLGTVAPGACGYFQASVQVPCTADIVGKYLCMDAHVYPDDICLPVGSPWSGAQIKVTAECTGDSVRFTMRNNGLAATTQPLDYVIIDDMVIMMEKTLPANLPAGDSRTETIAANGDSYRLNIQQEPGHPSIFDPSVLVEYCNGVTANSLVQDFANEDGDFFTDFACREVVGSLDPNEKLAFPRGYGGEHYIEPNTYINYQIGFQNTGTDTAFVVVLRDTLSPLLDPASLRISNSSHPYTWHLDNSGHLEVRFSNILLPDSTTSEAASHGFIQFSIAQKSDNSIGSLIENRAGIYFDINPVVMTNTVWHTIGHDFVQTSATNDPKADRNLLSIYPNPAAETTFLALPQTQDVQVRVLNVLGKEVQHYTGKAPGIQLHRAGLPEGMYWIETTQNGRWKKSGKLIWKR